MKKLIIILILIFSGVVEAQSLATKTYYTSFIETLFDDPNATIARNTLELGEAHDPNFLSINILGDHINIATKKTPASSSASGTKGDLAWDENYFYGCIATDTWRRIPWTIWGVVSGEIMIYEDGDTMVFEDGNTMVYD